MVSSDYYNIKVKLPQKVSRTSTEVLFTCLNAVHQFKPDFMCVAYQVPCRHSYITK